MRSNILKKQARLFNRLLLTGTVILCFVLIFKEQRYAEYDNWRGVMWGDAAGYYVYLPALLIYGMDASELPEGIELNCGHGFSIDSVENRIVSKYFYGTSVMQLPFFLGVHTYARLKGLNANGFSPIYHQVLNISTVFWLLIGIIFLYKFLIRRFSVFASILAVFAVTLGSTAFYYGFFVTGMSHIYSFSIFSISIYALDQILVRNYVKTYLWLILLAFCVSLAILIRPTNALFILFVVFFEVNHWNDLKKRLVYFFRLPNFITLLIIFLLVLTPQLIYYKYISGSFFHYSYGDESFIYWNRPFFKAIFFAPKSGLFLYAPVLAVSLIGMIVMLVKKNRQGLLFLAIFMLISYLSASWYSIFFGECSYGARNFTEYFVLFSIPIAFLLNHSGNWKKIFLIGFVIMLSLINIKLTYSFDRCNFGKAWEWSEYKYLLLNRHLKKTQSFDNDTSGKCEIQGVEAFLFKPDMEFGGDIKVKQSTYAKVNFRRVWVKTRVLFKEPDTDVSLIVAVTKDGETIHWSGYKLQDDVDELNQWTTSWRNFYLPLHTDIDSKISLFLWNHSRSSFAVEKITAKFK